MFIILTSVERKGGEWKPSPGSQILFQRFDTNLLQGTDKITEKASLYTKDLTCVRLD